MANGQRNNTMMYVKLAVSIILVAYLLAFMMINTNNAAEVWLFPFGGNMQMPTLLVIVITAVLSTVGWWLGSQLYRTWRRRRAGR